MPAILHGKRSSQFNPPPTKKPRVNTQYVRSHTRTTSHREDSYATVNLATILEQLQNEIDARKQRRKQADCVRRVSILFDVFGYVVMLPRLQKKYTGPLIIKDWHDDVRTLLESSFEQRQLNEEQQKLVQTIEKIATSRDLLNHQQWRCLLCLNLVAGASEKGKKMKIIHHDELQKVKELAICLPDEATRSTVLQLIHILENTE